MRLRIAKPFNDPEYIFELKHDGFRALAYVEEGTCRLVSRNSNLFKSFESDVRRRAHRVRQVRAEPGGLEDFRHGRPQQSEA